MPKTRTDEAAGLTVADVIHTKSSSLPASTTVGEVRDWFAASKSRRMAFLADDVGRYAGTLSPSDVAEDVDADRPAAEVARNGPTVSPDASATTGQELALLTDARRVPVVDSDGRLLGVVSVTGDLKAFCGTG